ncbi:retrotransposable element [Cordyceps javanica]|nr:retrotransposable element [Cordyceps javanica]
MAAAVRPMSIGDTDDSVPYTNSDYRQDAIWIELAQQEVDKNSYTNLRPLLSAHHATVQLAIAITRSIKTRDRQQAEARGIRQMGHGSPLDDIATMTSLLHRFSSGPNADDKPDTPVRGRPQRTSESNSSPSPPPPRRSRQPPQHQSWGTTPLAVEHSSSRRHFKAELLAFDSQKVDVASYISQIRWMAETMGSDTVLQNLALGILSDRDSDGYNWFIGLSESTKQRLAKDLHLWYDLLEERFKRDRGAIMVEADNLKHNFAKEDTLSLQKYLDRKKALYREAGGMDEDQTARRILYDADPSLAVLIDAHHDLTVDYVTRQMLTRHHGAKREWEARQQQMQRTIQDHRSSYDRRDRRYQDSDAYRRDSGFSPGPYRDSRPDRRGSSQGIIRDGSPYPVDRDRKRVNWQDRPDQDRGWQDRSRDRPDRRDFKPWNDRPWKQKDPRDGQTREYGVKREDGDGAATNDDSRNTSRRDNNAPRRDTHQPVTLSADQYKKIFNTEPPARPVKAYLTHADNGQMELNCVSDAESSDSDEALSHSPGSPSKVYTINNDDFTITSNSHLHGYIYTNKHAITVTLDTASGLNLISRQWATTYFPDAPQDKFSPPWELNGVGGSAPIVTDRLPHPVRVFRGQKLGTLSPITVTDKAHVFRTTATAAIGLGDLMGPDCPEDTPEDPRRPDGYPFHIQPPDDTFELSTADIATCWGEEYTQKLRELVSRHRELFRPGIGRFNDGIKMPITFREDADISDLSQRPYAISRRDRIAMDNILDPLRAAGVVEDVPLGEPCPVASPAFVVWRDDKPRVVVDLRRVNTKLRKDAYPLPRQDDILSSLKGSSVFSVLDLTKGFFQQPIEETDKWKTSFITPHRGHERLTLETGLGIMGYYREFVDHFSSVADPLNRLKAQGFRYAPAKNPARDSFAAKATFPFRIEIPKDTSTPAARRVAERIARQNENADALWEECKVAWETLKTRLVDAVELAHPDFGKPFEMHVDGSKERGFGVALHQEQEDGRMRPILFLSKSLSPAEQNYGATELETAALVWGLQKLEHYLDNSEVVVVSDHTAIRDTFASVGNGKPKGRYRLVNWRLYLERWRHNVKVKYREGRAHVNADALSRLPTIHDSANVLLLTADQTPVPPAFPTANEFMQKVAQTLPSDPTFRKIISHLQAADAPPILHQFALHPDSKLLYYYDDTNWRLCVPDSLVRDVIRMGHDDRSHAGGALRTYLFLRDCVFFHNMRRRVAAYVKTCPECQKSLPRRSLPYGDMQPVDMPKFPFATVCLDFVTGLPLDDGVDCLLVIVDKFSRLLRCLEGGTDWTAQQWADHYVKHVYPDWGMPHQFVHDADPKFVSKLWQALCKASNTASNPTAAYHQQANGLSERTIQTLVLCLRAVIGARYDTSPWRAYLPHILFSLNTSVQSTTNTSPFELLYGRKPRHFLQLTDSDDSMTEDYGAAQRARFSEAWDAAQLSVARTKIYYDSKHTTPPKLRLGDLVYVKLAKPGADGYHLNHQTKLSHRRAGPFPITKCISALRFELGLPSYLNWRPEFSIEHLEPVPAGTRTALPPGPVKSTDDKDTDKYVIEKILAHRTVNRKQQYKIRWMNYDETHDSWEPEDILREDVPKLLDHYKKQNLVARGRLSRPR